MKKNFRLWVGAAAGAAIAMVMGSCAYDPYYPVGGAYGTGYGYGEGYGVGYGAGYGYGNSNFSTALFVGTGDPRWGYDPYCYSYYDYSRRCYYDPYLYGYYPMGYRPPIVYGVPHPHGFNRSYCPPPHRVNNITLGNYNNRHYAYRNSSYPWAGQVRPHNGTYRGLPPAQTYPRSGNINASGIHGPGPSGYPRTYGGGTINSGAINHANYSQSGIPLRSNVPLRTNSHVYSNPSVGATGGHFNPPQGGPQIHAQRPPLQPRISGPAAMPSAPHGRVGPASQGAAHQSKGQKGDEGVAPRGRSNR